MIYLFCFFFDKKRYFICRMQNQKVYISMLSSSTKSFSLKRKKAFSPILMRELTKHNCDIFCVLLHYEQFEEKYYKFAKKNTKFKNSIRCFDSNIAYVRAIIDENDIIKDGFIVVSEEGEQFRFTSKKFIVIYYISINEFLEKSKDDYIKFMITKSGGCTKK